MEAQSLSSHQHSWWFSCFSLREKLARSHNESGTEIGNFEEIRFRRPTSAQLSRAIKADLSAH